MQVQLQWCGECWGVGNHYCSGDTERHQFIQTPLNTIEQHGIQSRLLMLMIEQQSVLLLMARVSFHATHVKCYDFNATYPD